MVASHFNRFGEAVNLSRSEIVVLAGEEGERREKSGGGGRLDLFACGGENGVRDFQRRLEGLTLAGAGVRIDTLRAGRVGLGVSGG